MPEDAIKHYYGTLAVDASSLVTIPVAEIGQATNPTIPIPVNKQLLVRLFGLESTFTLETRVELQYAADGVTFTAIRSWNLPTAGDLDEDYDGVGILTPAGSATAAIRFQAIQADDTAVRLSISVEIQTNEAEAQSHITNYYGTHAGSAALATVSMAAPGGAPATTISIPSGRQLVVRVFELESSYVGETRCELQYSALGIVFSAFRTFNLPANGQFEMDMGETGIITPAGSGTAVLRLQIIQVGGTGRLSLAVDIQNQAA